MIANLEPTGAKTRINLYQLKIVVHGTKPPIWRRLLVPGNANLGWLHAAIQVATGWTNSHLHQFQIGTRGCSDPDFHLNAGGDDSTMLDEQKTLLMEAAPRVGAVLGYEYDFGDSWEHAIAVEKILALDAAAATTARCLDGARACPPEDCGGVSGYADLLKVIKNPKHAEHDAMMEWLGGGFDPEAFDAEEANIYLRRLKWPRVTEGQLRKVLMARDDYRA